MSRRAPSRGPGRPPCWWDLLGTWLALSAPQAARLWHLVSTSRSPEVRAWRLTCVYFHGHPGDRASSTAFLSGPLRPTRVISVLEQLVEEGTLRRKEANVMEAHILEQTTATGYWT